MILEPKLNPFVKKHSLIIQQDGGPSPKAEINQELLLSSGVDLVNWSGNSPDLNQIEPY